MKNILVLFLSRIFLAKLYVFNFIFIVFAERELFQLFLRFRILITSFTHLIFVMKGHWWTGPVGPWTLEDWDSQCPVDVCRKPQLIFAPKCQKSLFKCDVKWPLRWKGTSSWAGEGWAPGSVWGESSSTGATATQHRRVLNTVWTGGDIRWR